MGENGMKPPFSAALHRARFIRGDFWSRRAPLRPPWAVPEPLFDERCNNCGDCISACPEHILKFGRGKLPVVDFQRGACTFCEKCLHACKKGALSRKSDPPWLLRASLTGGCLARRGVACRTCGDACEESAIKFRLRVGGFSEPEFDLERCTGCGACIAPCPGAAIKISVCETSLAPPLATEM